jgi:hypothetical protein
LDIEVKQGGTTLISQTDVTISPTDPLDGNTRYNIGSLGGGLSTAYLSIYVANPTGNETAMSFYIRAGTPGDANVPGVAPLLDLGKSGKVDVYIRNLVFSSAGSGLGVTLSEFSAPEGDYAAAFYMMDSGGWFYELPQWRDFLPTSSIRWAEVPHSAFRDGNPSEYQFDDDTGTSLDIAWRNVFSPVDTQYTLKYPFTWAEKADESGGKVFEMGMAPYAWTYVIPEPATLGVVLWGLIFLRRRR